MKMHDRLVRFLAVSAWDLLLPDLIHKPIKVIQNVYHCFLAADPREKLDLLREAQSLSDAQTEELVDALATEWKAWLPRGQLADAQRAMLRQVVRCLHGASNPAAAANPGEALRQSLNGSLLAGVPQQIAPLSLQPEQQAVGRSLVHAALAGKARTRGAQPLPPNPTPVPGYQMVRVLGSGAFCMVYLGIHTSSGEHRALKVGRLDDPARFQREVRLLRTLGGPHIVRYHEHGELPGRFWIAMEHLGEYTLADLIAAGPTAEQALLLAEQVLRGLDTLHQAGVIHRDLKPENAMVGDDFRLRLIDFGLAKPVPGSPAARSVSMSAGLIGTPRYMSPEQIRGETPTFAADMWAFGCILVELLTGRPAFESDNIMALGHEIMTREVRFDQAEVPPEVRDFLKRCLQRDPARRWKSAGEALSDYAAAAGAARHRLRHERFRKSWQAIVEKGLLEQFAAKHQGQRPGDAAGEFAAFARQEGIEAVDEERVNEVLGPIFDCQGRVAAAEQAVTQARQRLQQEVTHLSSDDLARRAEQLRALEKEPQKRQREVKEKIASLVAAELRGWKEKCREEQKRKRKRPEARPRRLVTEAATLLVLAFLIVWGLVLAFLIVWGLSSGAFWPAPTTAAAKGMGPARSKSIGPPPSSKPADRPPAKRDPEPSKTDSPHAPPPQTDSVLLDKVKKAFGIDLALIPAGEFDMGSTDDDKDAFEDEKPRHKVTMAQPFYLGKTEVTVGQFKRFVDATGYQTEAEKAGDKKTWKSPGFAQEDDHPVVYVSWNGAVAYCDWLGKEIGKKVRLPREAEWEYSCRAGSDKKFCFGDDEATLGNYAWYLENTGYGTKPCGQKKENAFQLKDMHGNVWEWCLDDKRNYKDPEGSASGGASRVFRGGSFDCGPRSCRAAYRLVYAPSARYGNVGFRVLVPR
jgi:formylglycine-generating enzyme required for sulfatase activity